MELIYIFVLISLFAIAGIAWGIHEGHVLDQTPD